MAKLIYSEASYKNVCTDEGALLAEALLNDATKNNYYRCLLITTDGYFITHGKTFKMVDVDSLIINVSLTRTNGVITLKDNVTEASTTLDLPVWKLTESDGITITDNNGNWTIKLTAPTKDETNDNSFGTSYSDGVLTFGKGTYDSLGRITSFTLATSLHVDYVYSKLESETKYYLLGSTSSNEDSRGGAVRNNAIFVDFVNTVALLNIPRLKINGTDNIILDSGNTSLSTYIANKVDEAKTLALVYLGSILLDPKKDKADTPKSPSISGVTNGDVYKIKGNGYILLKSDSEDPSKNLVVLAKTGDLIIAKFENDSFAEWDFIPSGDEDETYIKYGTNTPLSGIIEFTGNGVDYTDGKFVFTNTTYEIFRGAHTGEGDSQEGGTSGLVPAPLYNQSAYYLAGDGSWKALPTINSGALTLMSGDYLVGNSFNADSSGGVTYTIPYANVTTSTNDDGTSSESIISGVIKGNDITEEPSTYGWKQARILNGIVEYYINKYSYSGTECEANYITIGKFTDNGTESDIKVPYAKTATLVDVNSVTKYYGVVGTTSTVTDITNYYASPIVDGIVYYQNTWRPIYAYTSNELSTNLTSTDIRQSSITTEALEFSSDFIAVNSDSTRGEELYITWAEVGADGETVTYSY